MSRKIIFVLLITLIFTVQSVFGQDYYELDDDDEAIAYWDAETSIPDSIRNNGYYRESLRLAELAQETYDNGDYDASTRYAEQAIYYAELSDEYVANRMVSEARVLMNWADSNDIANKYPEEYTMSRECYEASVTSQLKKDWNEAIDNAAVTINILSSFEGSRTRTGPLPSQYTVRTWTSFKDCLWNIAGYSWVYGDPEKWVILYEANKSKLDNPNNPDIIEPGMIIDIPSISGEVRQGMWDPARVYNR